MLIEAAEQVLAEQPVPEKDAADRGPHIHHKARCLEQALDPLVAFCDGAEVGGEKRRVERLWNSRVELHGEHLLGEREVRPREPEAEDQSGGGHHTVRCASEKQQHQARQSVHMQDVRPPEAQVQQAQGEESGTRSATRPMARMDRMSSRFGLPKERPQVDRSLSPPHGPSDLSLVHTYAHQPLPG